MEFFQCLWVLLRQEHKSQKKETATYPWIIFITLTVSLFKDHQMHSDGVGSNIHLASPIGRQECFLSLPSFLLLLISKSVTHPLKHRKTQNLFNGRMQRKRKHLIIDLLWAARQITWAHIEDQERRNGREEKEQGLIRLWSVSDLLLIWIGWCCHGDGALSPPPLRWAEQVLSEPTKARVWLVKQ